MKSRFACCLSLALGMAGLAAGALWGIPNGQAEASSRQPTEMDGGYYLLEHVSNEESNVHLLFMVKDAPDEISTFADQLSKTADETKASLEYLQDKYPTVHFDDNPLPQIERDVRASIRDDKEHQLLFGATGTDFVRAFLITQIEASTYAINLSKVLADQETNPHRAKILRQISTKWLGMRDQAYRLLKHY
jgi:hypothetical protein